MQRYSCRILNRDGSIDAVLLGEFPGNVEATRAARSALLVSLTGLLVELWTDGRIVTALTREVAQFRRRPEPFPTHEWSAPAVAAE